MAAFFSLNREATTPADQTLFWGAFWCGLLLTVAYVGLVSLSTEVAGPVEAAWRSLLVLLLVVAIFVGARRYEDSGGFGHLLMEWLLAMFPALASLETLGVLGLPGLELLVLGSVLLLFFFILPLLMQLRHRSHES